MIIQFTLFLLLAFLISYLLGAFPSSVVIGRLFYKIDPRNEGSGNSGATNSFRLMGKKAGFWVVFLDMAKGLLAFWLVSMIIPVDSIVQWHSQSFEGMQQLTGEVPIKLYYENLMKILCGIMAVIGHVYSPFLKFRGGKGVATSTAILVSIFPIPALLLIPLFFIILTLTGIVSLSSLVTVSFLPLVIGLFNYFDILMIQDYHYIISILMVFLIWFTHRKNVMRLIHKEESKFPKVMLVNFIKKRKKESDRDHQ